VGTYTATITGTGSSATTSGLAPGTYIIFSGINCGCSSSNLEVVEMFLYKKPFEMVLIKWISQIVIKTYFTANYNQTIDLIVVKREVKKSEMLLFQVENNTL
jgi:hypothetical protein